MVATLLSFCSARAMKFTVLYEDRAASTQIVSTTFIVMLTGCMALVEEFEGLRVLHRFTVEILMVYFPFSRLMHAFMFIPSRAFTGAWFGRRGVKA